MTRRKDSFFWISYSDLMTSLFFVMLVLFVIVMFRTDSLKQQVIATQEELDKIKKIENSTKDLAGEYFSYNEKYEKFILNIRCWFPKDKSDISYLNKDTQNALVEAGKEVENFLKSHYDNKYLVIIEGQASKDAAGAEYNYKLSFQRALKLVKFWKMKVGPFPDNCELQIAGSGDGSYNGITMREFIEEVNQRFLIYVIPKNIIKDDE